MGVGQYIGRKRGRREGWGSVSEVGPSRVIGYAAAAPAWMTIMFRELDTVVLTKDLPDHGLRRGDLGAVVHVGPAGVFEVEFVTAAGRTQALVALESKDLRAVADTDLVAVRDVR